MSYEIIRSELKAISKEDGSEFIYPLENLDESSQAQAKKLGAP